jgi:hypothetical protein
MQAAATDGPQAQMHAFGSQEREHGCEGCELRTEKPTSWPQMQEPCAKASQASASEARGSRHASDVVREFAEDETQLATIRELMMRAAARGVWLTLGEIAGSTEFAEASISAQLRHLRKPHNGGHCVEKRRRAAARSAGARQKAGEARRRPVIWEYRVLTPQRTQDRRASGTPMEASTDCVLRGECVKAVDEDIVAPAQGE